jgi:hypothetical protein
MVRVRGDVLELFEEESLSSPRIPMTAPLSAMPVNGVVHPSRDEVMGLATTGKRSLRFM